MQWLILGNKVMVIFNSPSEFEKSFRTDQPEVGINIAAEEIPRVTSGPTVDEINVKKAGNTSDVACSDI